eukprot:g15090.t2
MSGRRLASHGRSNWRLLLGAKQSPVCLQLKLQKRLSAADGDQALELFDKESRRFDTVHVLTAMRAVALSPPSRSPHTLGRLLNRAVSLMPELAGNDLAALAWSLASICTKEAGCGVECGARGLTAAVPRVAATLAPSELTVVAWALAKLSEPSDEAIAAIVRQARFRIGRFKCKDAVHLAWALSKMQARDMDFMQQLAGQTLDGISVLSRQDTGNAAWAFAKADVLCRPLMRSIRAKFLAESTDFNAQEARLGTGGAYHFVCLQELASIVWAFAWLDAADEVLLQRFQSALLCRAPELNAGGLARVSWALASMGVAEGRLFQQELDGCDPSLLLAIAKQAEERVANLNARDVDMIAWSLAKANAPMPSFIAKLATRAVCLAADFDAQGLANSISSIPALTEQISSFSAQALCDLQWSFAFQSWADAALQEAIWTAPGWEERPRYVHDVQAGAVADCFKHLLLVALLQRLQATQGACEHGDESLLYVDTHAGAGMYQLQAAHAANIERLLTATPARR